MTNWIVGECKDLSADELVTLAKLAEQAERYDDMAAAMKFVTEKKETLTNEERNLLSVAYKNVIGTRRSAWRNMITSENPNADRQKQLVSYREKIVSELNTVCKEIIDIIDRNLIPTAQTDESKVFYLKMKGDYYRYLAEVGVKDSDDRKVNAEQAKAAYTEATQKAEKLPKNDPILLGLALNFSVFHYEIMGDHEHASKVAKMAYDDAFAMQNSGPSEYVKDSNLIMQLLADNLKLWMQDNNEEIGRMTERRVENIDLFN